MHVNPFLSGNYGIMHGMLFCQGFWLDNSSHLVLVGMLHPRVVGDRSNAASSIHSYYTFKGIKAYLAFIFQKDFSLLFSQCKHIENRQSTEKTTTRCTNARNVSGTSQLNTSLPPPPPYPMLPPSNKKLPRKTITTVFFCIFVTNKFQIF